MLKDRIKELFSIVEGHSDYLEHNRKLLKIYKGKLLPYIEAELAKQFTGESYSIAIKRIPPINVLKRIIDKQSKIYAGGVRREVSGGNASDENILSYMMKILKPDMMFSTWNSYFNLFKNSLVQPYLKSNGLPGIRVIPSDRFIPFSDDEIDSDNPTGFIIYIKEVKEKGKSIKIYMAIDKNDYCYFTNEQKDYTPQMTPQGQPVDYRNQIGVVPFVYLNRDNENIVPEQDTDVISMTTLIPILLTDINFAHMFQSFSIMYGINVNFEGLKFQPNALWSFKSAPDDERKPEVGTLASNADISGGLSLVANQFALWLNTKGIKPGAIGEVNGSNFSTGISKIMDEMDTSEDRTEQIPYFVNAESEFWNLMLKHMLPFWSRSSKYSGVNATFSVAAEVVTVFSEQVPLMRRGQLIDDTIKEIDNGFITKRDGLKRLNPHMTDKQIDEKELELSAEKNSTTITEITG